MMQAPIACETGPWRSSGRLSGSQPSAWFWAWSWDPPRFMRRHPPHHLSPARANHTAGQDPGARLSLPSHHSNAPIKPESQSILSKIVAHFPQSLKAKHSGETARIAAEFADCDTRVYPSLLRDRIG